MKRKKIYLKPNVAAHSLVDRKRDTIAVGRNIPNIYSLFSFLSLSLAEIHSNDSCMLRGPSNSQTVCGLVGKHARCISRHFRKENLVSKLLLHCFKIFNKKYLMRFTFNRFTIFFLTRPQTSSFPERKSLPN